MCSSTAEKITSDVSFPWTLDIAPYCSVQCQVIINSNIHQPNHRQYRIILNVSKNKLSPGQNKLLYSLYGVVEHEGGLHSGHYFAYIKVNFIFLLTNNHCDEFISSLQPFIVCMKFRSEIKLKMIITVLHFQKAERQKHQKPLITIMTLVIQNRLAHGILSVIVWLDK